jgi:hypothetical protein
MCRGCTYRRLSRADVLLSTPLRARESSESKFCLVKVPQAESQAQGAMGHPSLTSSDGGSYSGRRSFSCHTSCILFTKNFC